MRAAREVSGSPSTNGHQPYRATTLANVEPERVRWLWPSRLPLGKLVVLDGDPDVGKSTLTLDLAARVTTGRPMPGVDLAAVPAADVILLAAEDGLGDTIRPRLDAAGADAARVHHLDAAPAYDDDGRVVGWGPPTIPGGVPALEALVVETGAVLVVVDVLMAYLHGRADAHRDQDVRQALAPMADMAGRTGCCVMLVRHIPKSQRRAGQAIAAGTGSIGIIGAVRAGMLAGPDPDDDTGQRRVLARSKGNLAPPWPSLSYQLVCATCGATACEATGHGPARIEWLGVSHHSGDSLLSHPPDPDERSALDEAAAWLVDLLATMPDQEMSARSVKAAARDAGMAIRTVERARTQAGVTTQRVGFGQDSQYVWRLDAPPCSPPDPRARQLASVAPNGEHGEHGANMASMDRCLVCGGPGDHPRTTHRPVTEGGDP